MTAPLAPVESGRDRLRRLAAEDLAQMAADGERPQVDEGMQADRSGSPEERRRDRHARWQEQRDAEEADGYRARFAHDPVTRLQQALLGRDP